jgi:hypothetical protein
LKINPRAFRIRDPIGVNALAFGVQRLKNATLHFCLYLAPFGIRNFGF